MNIDFAALFKQLLETFTRLPLSQKVAVPLLIVVSMGAIVFVSRWASRPDYAVLFSGLEESDAASVVEKLKDDKIGFNLRDDGSTVEVTPADLVHDLRLQFAAAGLPKGDSVGYELFDKSSIVQTRFGEKLNLIRALQGELERTIQSINAIKTVRVHITKPERSVFIKRDILPTASVLLRLRPGQELTQLQVNGISNLVANSVERLTPENVTIIDAHGNILNTHEKGVEFEDADDSKLTYKSKIESDYSRRIETMLAEVLGPGRAVARVTADIDFSKYEREEEAFDPAGQVVRSARKIEESAGLGADGGVPGVVSNLTNDPALLPTDDESLSANSRKESVTNYEITRAVSKTIAPSGNVEKLSVAVLVDGTYITAEPTEAGVEATPVYQPLEAEMISQIDKLVKQSVGFDASRGDIVTVENIRFFQPDDSIAEAIEKAETWEMVYKTSSWIWPGIFILFFFLFLVRPLVRFLTGPGGGDVDLTKLLPAGIEELEAELDEERRKMNLAGDDSLGGVDIEELEELLAENSRVVKENPEQAALLIRYWLNEGRM